MLFIRFRLIDIFACHDDFPFPFFVFRAASSITFHFAIIFISPLVLFSISLSRYFHIRLQLSLLIFSFRHFDYFHIDISH